MCHLFACEPDHYCMISLKAALLSSEETETTLLKCRYPHPVVWISVKQRKIIFKTHHPMAEKVCSSKFPCLLLEAHETLRLPALVCWRVEGLSLCINKTEYLESFQTRHVVTGAVRISSTPLEQKSWCPPSASLHTNHSPRLGGFLSCWASTSSRPRNSLHVRDGKSIYIQTK